MNFTSVPTNITTSLSAKQCHANPVYFSLMAVIHILTFVVNFLTAVAIWRLPGLEGNKYHLVVRTLIVSDCLISLSSLPMSMISFINCGWVGGAVACILSAFFSTAFLSWSAMIVIVMCVMRFLAVKKPLLYRNSVTYLRIKKGLAVAFIWGVLHLALPLAGLGKFRLYERGYFCALDITPVRPKDKTLVYITVTEGCLVMTALVYFSIVVMVLVKKKRRVSTSLSVQQRRGVGVEAINKREGGFATMTFVIVLVYCICYVPFLIYRTVVVVRGPSLINEYTYYFTELIAHLNPLLNPVVYVACSRQYRSSIKRLFDNCCLYRLSLLMQKYLVESYGGSSSIELRKMSSLSARSETTIVE
ncbi:opsin-3-like [Actinia tenebrosa]|uniref:Opsin-3-like n=1 Tax=Actinia tenebrosa TaxID=6105 RepID=A0A6P8J5I8_ACTTE|nr:opsin-3-like [Actinia tenebrosa]